MRAMSSAWCLAGLLCLPAPAHAQRGQSLTEAAAEGVRALASARLDRLNDMATADLAPLDDVAMDGTWPDGSPPQEAAWDHCELGPPAAPVDLHAAPLLPMQVSVASRGGRAAALVALGRPGSDRHGMAFPESRWIEWETPERASVRTLRGFLPGAALALRPEGATILSYSRPDAQTPAQRASHVRDVDIPLRVAITQLGANAEIVHGPNEIEFTDGWDIDSNVAVWRHGSAVVLGRATNAPEDRRRHEVLHFFDARGHAVRPFIELTDQGREEGLGASLASLVAAPDERSLAAAWTVPTGPLAGVWVRRGITLDALPFRPGTSRIIDAPPPAPGARPRRQPAWYPRGLWVYQPAQGNGFWGPVVTRGGVAFQRVVTPTPRGAPFSEVMFSPWPASRNAVTARALGTWADPLPVWSPGGPVVAGGSSADEGALLVAYTAQRERAIRTVSVPLERLPGLQGAADVAMCPTDTGALLVWIDGGGDTERRLSVARIACQRVAGRARRSGR